MGCAANSIGGLERTESALHGADRPFCKGRNYDPDRYAPKSMEE